MCSMPSWARARPTWLSFVRSTAPPATGVCAAQCPMLGAQARALQRLLHKRVAEGDAVVAAGLAQEVPDVEALVVRPIEVQHPLDFGNGRALGRRRLTAPIHQPVIAVVLVAPPQPSNTPRTPAEDVGSLEPRQLPTERSQDDLLDLHGALHGADGVGHGHLLGDQFSPGARLERSFHVALGSGQIMYSRHPGTPWLTRVRRAYTLAARESVSEQAASIPSRRPRRLLTPAV